MDSFPAGYAKRNHPVPSILSIYRIALFFVRHNNKSVFKVPSHGLIMYDLVEPITVNPSTILKVYKRTTHHYRYNFQITDLYCPRPSRGFAFVQFVEARVAKSLLEKDHVIKGVSVHIGAAKPKGPAASRNDFGGGGGVGGRGGHYGDRDRGNQGSWQRHAHDRHDPFRDRSLQYDPFRDRWV